MLTDEPAQGGDAGREPHGAQPSRSADAVAAPREVTRSDGYPSQHRGVQQGQRARDGCTETHRDTQ
jgi:hypothetical protein